MTAIRIPYQYKDLKAALNRKVAIAPLLVFRILFGLLTLIASIRFIAKGWVEELYLKPIYFFSYYGFSWVKPLPDFLMYAVFGLLILSSILILLGYRYKIGITAFFLLFTYVELIDKTNYLNHYYFISLLSFLMIWLPLNRDFSLDCKLGRVSRLKFVPAWTVYLLQLQIGIVYFFAGLAKLNTEWLLKANPLKIWLPAHQNIAIIGTLLTYKATAFFFSWAGALYDLSIPFLLKHSKTRRLAYLAVLVFHGFTALLFPIGMFPYVMILLTLIFFPPSSHEFYLNKIRNLFSRDHDTVLKEELSLSIEKPGFSIQKPVQYFLTGIIALQLLLPFRHAAYSGNLFWNEQGYRFSWRVMLMEKSGHLIYHVEDTESGQQAEVNPSDYLTLQQVKMLSTQPDMILQFAHFIRDEYNAKGIQNIKVSAESYVNLNGSGSRRFIDPTVDLGKQAFNFKPKTWVLPFEG